MRCLNLRQQVFQADEYALSAVDALTRLRSCSRIASERQSRGRRMQVPRISRHLADRGVVRDVAVEPNNARHPGAVSIEIAAAAKPLVRPNYYLRFRHD